MSTIDKNINQSEISKFETVASCWRDREGEFGALHDINETRGKHINTRAGLAGKQVLDIGCDGGILSETMAEIGAEVTGIDAGLLYIPLLHHCILGRPSYVKYMAHFVRHGSLQT